MERFFKKQTKKMNPDGVMRQGGVGGVGGVGGGGGVGG